MSETTSSKDELARLMEALRTFARERDWEQYHSPKNLAMALSVEAAELLEHFQWLTEAESGNLNDEQRTAVAYEMADVFAYLLQLADALKVDLFATMWVKMELSALKYPVELARGRADKYTTYE